MAIPSSRRILLPAALLGAGALAVLLDRVRRGAGTGTSGIAEIRGDTWPPVPVNTGDRG